MTEKEKKPSPAMIAASNAVAQAQVNVDALRTACAVAQAVLDALREARYAIEKAESVSP